MESPEKSPTAVAGPRGRVDRGPDPAGGARILAPSARIPTARACEIPPSCVARMYAELFGGLHDYLRRHSGGSSPRSAPWGCWLATSVSTARRTPHAAVHGHGPRGLSARRPPGRPERAGPCCRRTSPGGPRSRSQIKEIADLLVEELHAKGVAG